MLAVDVESISLAGSFLIGAVFGTVAVLRVLRSVTDFLAGVERRRRRHEEDEEP